MNAGGASVLLLVNSIRPRGRHFAVSVRLTNFLPLWDCVGHSWTKPLSLEAVMSQEFGTESWEPSSTSAPGDHPASQAGVSLW